MKKLALLLLLLIYQSILFAQLNQILYKEFCEFVEAQQSGQPIEPKVDPLVYLQLDEPYKSYKKKVKKQVLDSIVLHSNSSSNKLKKIRELFTYDKHGNQLSALKKYFNRDSTSSSTSAHFKYKYGRLVSVNKNELNEENINEQYKADYFYRQGKINEYRLLFLNQQKNEWSIYRKVKYSYNSDNNITNINHFEIDTIGRENLLYKINYNYNENKIIIELISPGISLQWIHLFSKKKLVKAEFIQYMNGRAFEKRITIYDDSGQITNIKSEVYNVTAAAFEQLFTYDTDGKLATKTTTSATLSNSYKIVKTNFTYDENGYLGSEIDQVFDEEQSIFTNEKKITYIYDKYGNLDMKVYFNWSFFSKDWYESIREINTFNTNFTFEDILFPEYINFSPVDFFGYILTPNNTPSYYDSSLTYNPFDYRHWNMQTSYSESFSLNSSEYFSVNYYYSEQKLNLNNKTQPDIIVYPNPAYNYFTIDLATLPINSKIKMYNLSGFKVMEQPVFSEELIYINHLQSGLYYFQLFVDGDKVERTGKLMIR